MPRQHNRPWYHPHYKCHGYERTQTNNGSLCGITHREMHNAISRCNNHQLFRGREEIDALVVPVVSNNQLWYNADGVQCSCVFFIRAIAKVRSSVEPLFIHQPAKPVEISSTINDVILTCSRMLFIVNKRDNKLNQCWYEWVHWWNSTMYQSQSDHDSSVMEVGNNN